MTEKIKGGLEWKFRGLGTGEWVNIRIALDRVECATAGAAGAALTAMLAPMLPWGPVLGAYVTARSAEIVVKGKERGVFIYIEARIWPQLPPQSIRIVSRKKKQKA